MGVKKLKIAHLYAKEMNIYGDNGNILTLQWRLAERGMKSEVVQVNVGDKIPKNVDIIVAGGGQDSCQTDVEADLLSKKKQLTSMHNDGVVMLTICGVYQLFGHFFKINDDQQLRGISIFDVETIASQNRHIGNVVVESDFGQLVGFENHSGETFLAKGQASFAKVIKGTGNNEASKEEGARCKNTFGSYMHGPLLPKNPVFADELLRLAGERKWGSIDLEPIDDMFAQKAAEIASHRPR